MASRALVTAALFATGCRGILGIEGVTAVPDGPGSTTDAPVDASVIDSFTLLDSVPVDSVLSDGVAAVQAAFADPIQGSSVVVTLMPQTAGDLNIVVIGWLGAGVNLVSVTDQLGNPYSLAGSLVTSSSVRLVMFYGKLGFGGTNAISVSFDQTAMFPDVRVVEYSGVSAMVDGFTSDTGLSTNCDSGMLATTHSHDLLIGANMTTTNGFVTSVGNGFNERVLSIPDKDVLADRTVATTGSFSATATLDTARTWIMELVAFKAAN